MTADLIRAWAAATGADPAVGEALAEQAHRDPRSAHGSNRGPGALARSVAEIRQVVTGCSEFALAAVPELLQIPAYATAVANAAAASRPGSGSAVSAVVARLMNEQSILYDPERSFSFVLSEAALRYKAGPAEMLRA